MRDKTRYDMTRAGKEKKRQDCVAFPSILCPSPANPPAHSYDSYKPGEGLYALSKTITPANDCSSQGSIAHLDESANRPFLHTCIQTPTISMFCLPDHRRNRKSHEKLSIRIIKQKYKHITQVKGLQIY